MSKILNELFITSPYASQEAAATSNVAYFLEEISISLKELIELKKAEQKKENEGSK